MSRNPTARGAVRRRRLRGLPQVGAVTPAELRALLNPMRELVDTWQGARGDALDRVVTFRDLSGLAASNEVLPAQLADVPPAASQTALVRSGFAQAVSSTLPDRQTEKALCYVFTVPPARDARTMVVTASALCAMSLSRGTVDDSRSVSAQLHVELRAEGGAVLSTGSTAAADLESFTAGTLSINGQLTVSLTAALPAVTTLRRYGLVMWLSVGGAQANRLTRADLHLSTHADSAALVSLSEAGPRASSEAAADYSTAAAAGF